MQVALGREPADLFIRGGTVVNVYSGELVPANVAVLGDRIAYVGPSEEAVGSETRVLDAAGLFVSPGWIEPHAHAYLYYTPESLAEAVLPGGTTTVVSDDLVFSVTGGAEASRAVMDAASRLPVRYLWHVRPEPASPLAPDEDSFDHARLTDLLDHPLAVGVGEAPAWARFLKSEESLYGTAISEAQKRGLVVDGHAAGARGERLAALVAAGLRSCHEAITADEALERLRLGLWTPLRHSSLRPDLPELLDLLRSGEVGSGRVMFTTDGPAPDVVAESGFIDGLLRISVKAGIPPVRAIQMATINPATYLYLDDHLGGIAPGRLADILLLPDLSSFRPETVVAGGRVAEPATEPAGAIDWASLGLRPEFGPGDWVRSPALYEPPPGADLPVIGFVSDVITREEEAPAGEGLPEGYLLAAHLTRDGERVVHALVNNLAPDLDGFATTATSSGHILALGRDPRAMAAAAARVRDLGGGVAFASGEEVEWEAELPLAGCMTPGPFGRALSAAREVKQRFRRAGYPFTEPLYSLLFLTADFLPGLRLVESGVLDVRSGKLVRKARPAGG